MNGKAFFSPLKRRINKMNNIEVTIVENVSLVDDPHGTQLEENIIDGGNMNLEDDLPGCHSCLHAKPADKDIHESSDEEFVGSVTVQGAKHGTPINCRSKIRVGHSSLQLTLVFCYLGLLWIDEPIFLSDIIRSVLFIYPKHASFVTVMVKNTLEVWSH